MAKIKMLKGLPGSGKTTLARFLVQTSGNAGRINRDDLRAMLFNSVWSGPREKIIVEAEKAIAQYATAQTFPYTALLFALLDRKEVAPIIWKTLRPTGNILPFKSDEE